MPEKTETRPPQRHPDRALVFLAYLLVILNAIYFGKMGLEHLLNRDEMRRRQTFQAAMETIESSYVTDVSREELFDAAMRGMIRGLEDPWSAYLTPREAERDRELTEGRFVGIGVVIMNREIIEVFEDGPAEKAGLLAGDVIVEVDGRDVVEVPTETLVDLVRGRRGTRVEVGVRRGEGRTVREITVTRDTVEIPNVKHEMLEDGIGRLEVNAFDQNMPGEVREALRDLQNQGLRGLVLDLRRNLGGLITSTVEVSDMFLSGGVIYRLESEKELSPADKKPATAGPEVVLPADVPIVVLTSAGTASAAEILAGSLQAHDRAVLLGAQTMGKGSVNANYSLPDGSAIYITVAHYVLANGRVVESQGLEPDVPFEFQMPTPPEEVRRDPAAGRRWLREQGQAADQAIREKAVELLLQRLDGDDAEEPDTDIETDT